MKKLGLFNSELPSFICPKKMLDEIIIIYTYMWLVIWSLLNIYDINNMNRVCGKKGKISLMTLSF